VSLAQKPKTDLTADYADYTDTIGYDYKCPEVFHETIRSATVFIERSSPLGPFTVVFIYDDKRGSLPIPRDWTDQALPSGHAGLIEPAPILDARCLLKLQDLVRAATNSIDDE
jgi:hypothetical protein